MVLYGEKKNERIVLTVTKDSSPTVFLNDEKGHPRAVLVTCNIENDSKVCYQSACLEQLSDCRGPKLRNFVRECARGCFAPVTCGGRG